MTQKLGKILTGASIASLLFLGTFGMHLGMAMDDHGNMRTDCPFMKETNSLCAMNGFQHIGEWRQIFNGVNTEKIALFLILLSLTAISSRLIKTFINTPPSSVPITIIATKINRNQKLSDYLVQAFSSGILHPKREI